VICCIQITRKDRYCIRNALEYGSTKGELWSAVSGTKIDEAEFEI
jgi:hypothetical protein